MVKPHRLVQSLAIGLMIFASLACTLSTPRSAQQQDPGLTVLAGSELQDLEPLLPEIQDATGVKMTFQYVGTLAGADQIAAGSGAGSGASGGASGGAADKPIDFAWFANAKYISLLHGASGRVYAQEPVMLSPVVVGVKTSQARAWGWVDRPDLTWRDVAEKAASGALHLAVANPASSNSGFSALVGVAASLAGETDALQPKDITALSSSPSGRALKALFKAQARSADSSGWLADQYVQDQNQLDGMVNYESVLLSLNKSGRLREPLTLVYPKEGILTADYPLLLINPNQRAAYQKVVAYLRSPAFQQQVMTQTLRRPVNPQVQLSSDFSTPLLVELPFPGSLEVVNQLLSASLDP